ncbi:MAG: YczE/YyaS/YitT family protein [Actinomycetes bacterium]
MNAGHRPDRVRGGLEVLGRPSWPELRRRLPRLVLGILVLGVGVAATVQAELGISPYDVLHQGIARVTGIDFGVVVIGLGLLILLLWFPLGQPFGVGTIANVLTVGLVIDAALGVLPHVEPLAVRIPLLLGGTVLIGLGAGLYIGAGLGPGPRDGLMTAFARRGHPLWLVRTVLEFSALAVGFVLGGDVGIGTVLIACSIGPLAHGFLARLHLGVRGADPQLGASLGE